MRRVSHRISPHAAASEATTEKVGARSNNGQDGVERHSTSNANRFFRMSRSFSSTASTPDASLANSSHDGEVQGDDSPLSDLSDDLLLHVMQFCQASDLRNLLQVNHQYRDLLAKDASNLWKEQYHHRWNWLTTSTSCHLVDDLHLATPAVTGGPSNYSLLLSLASDHKATKCDESIYAPCRWNPYLRRFLPTSPGTDAELEAVQIHGQAAVKYTGPIGIGDRCVRADQPFPRPHVILHGRRRRRNNRTFLSRIKKRFSPSSSSKRRQQHHHQRDIFRPFVAPFVDKTTDASSSDDADVVINLTPRLISYFEVSIIQPAEDTTSNQESNNNNDNNETETVGIGLATEDFNLFGNMPGWDDSSYGCHGDDGGLYHSNGEMVREFAPRFGAGDTVGCGLDYHNQAIFYTVNGEFLGYAFHLDDIMDKEYYPVVGVDTHCPVICNFGVDRPFEFDLSSMMKKQREVVLQSLQERKSQS